jgi:tol-pal system protein YbgF
MTKPPGRRTAAPTSVMRVNRAALAAALLIAAAAAPARAGLFDDEEARRRIEMLRKELAQQGNDNEARIQRLEESIRNIGVVELLRTLEELNAEIARLRGQMEVLANESQRVQKRQRDFYLDLDSRLKRLEGVAAASGGAAPPIASAAPSVVPPATPATTAPATSAPATAAGAVEFGPSSPRAATREEQAREVKAYDAASNLFRRNDFPSAIDAFKAFLKDYPGSQLASNANYWIGISYANMRDYPRALAAQGELLSKFPQSAKAPDAMLAIAAIQAEQGDNGSARNTLEDIIARYPLSEAAGKARTRLAALRSR